MNTPIFAADALQDALDAVREHGMLIGVGIGVLVVLLVLLYLWRLVRRSRPSGPGRDAELAIDLAALGDEGPPESGPMLEHYNVAMRLAAVVVAPAGRHGALPTIDALPALLDHIVPGLAEVVAAQKPLIRRWPAQLSARGFAHLAFSHAKLPGDAGRGTPWCSVAGRFKIKDQPVMAALILRAAAANNFAQSVIEEEHQWLSILRVRGGSS